MTKQEQNIINDFCESIWSDAMKEVNQTNPHITRLRTCKAWVYETPNYYVLRSYETFIACIEKTTDYLIDVLRMVYGYTSTSAQHINKFSKDYGQDKYGTTFTDVWRYV